MRLKLSNLLGKGSQSIIGFTLFAIQARYMSQVELAVFAVAQTIIAIVSLFDFGIGVSLTTRIVKSFKGESSSLAERRNIARKLMIQNCFRFFTVGIMQAIFFGVVFQFLVNRLNDNIDLSLSILFSCTVFLHSVGLNFGRIFLATGEIQLLVKLQLIGACIAFLGSALGLKSEYNLILSIFALSFSSIFLGFCALALVSINSTKDKALSDVEIDRKSNGEVRNQVTFLQIGQLLKVIYPILIQFILVSNFSPSKVIVYFACQRVVNSLGNIFGPEIQMNYSIPVISERLMLIDVARFKWNYVGFLCSSIVAILVVRNFWVELFSISDVPSFQTVLSFIPLGLFILVDQAVMYRLYAFGDFLGEMLASVIYVFLIILFWNYSVFSSIYLFNICLALAYAPKLAFSFILGRYIP
jgi:hypothetical protein